MIILRQRFSQLAGRLFTWGQQNKSLGYAVKTGSSSDYPKEVALPQKAVKVELGNNHSAVIGESGKLYTFGDDKHGSLGLNKPGFSPVQPTEISFFSKNGLKVVDVVCGQKHTIALTENGDVWSWGFGGRNINFFLRIFMSSSGSLGHGNNKHCFAPTPIQFFRQSKLNIKQIGGGRYFANAMDEQGKIYNWGIGEYGVFGNGQNKNLKTPMLNSYTQFLESEDGGKIKFKTIKSVYNYSVGQTTDGRIFAWGANEYGQLGVKAEIGVQLFETVNFIQEVEDLKGKEVKQFYLTEDTIIYLLGDGSVYWCGMKIAYRPEKFPLPEGVKPRLVGGGYRCFAVVDEENNLYIKNGLLKTKSMNKQTGVQTCSGTQVFGSKILQIGGKYRNFYAIVE